MSKKSFIDSITVPVPCTEDWNSMHGNDQVRFCSHCSKNVHNLAVVSRKQATRLVRASGGSLCIQYRQDSKTGAPVFAGQPVKIMRRPSSITTGVFVAAMGMSGVTYAQQPRASEPRTPDAIVAALKEGNRVDGASGRLHGIVVDPNGAVIPAAKIRAVSVALQATAETVSNHVGEYSFERLEPGRYLIEVVSHGFADFALPIELTAGRDSSLEVSMTVAGIVESLEV
jgi:hypothetical protein